MDQSGPDVSIGTERNNRIQGILTTIASKKMDSEMKILYNSIGEEIKIERDFLQTEYGLHFDKTEGNWHLTKFST